jgi:hypothetical protein
MLTHQQVGLPFLLASHRPSVPEIPTRRAAEDIQFLQLIFFDSVCHQKYRSMTFIFAISEHFSCVICTWPPAPCPQCFDAASFYFKLLSVLLKLKI